jgi:hypothetical protein
MITFSVNKGQEKMYSKEMVNFLAKVKQGVPYTAESIGLIVDTIIRAGSEVEDITEYSKSVEKLSELRRSVDEDKVLEPLITLDEFVAGYKGCLEEVLEGDSDIDIDYLYVDTIVEDFFKWRERYMYSVGHDIYISLKLSLMGEKKAYKRLEQLCSEDKEFKEVMYEVLTVKGVIEKIKSILE